jgi:hypothetical protein
MAVQGGRDGGGGVRAAPRLSVVIPVYDRADSIGPSLDSVTSQTHPSYEVIVVDDGSSDGLEKVIAEHWPQVRFFRFERNLGVSAARNRGVAEARGELIAFLDSDDLWSCDKLALQTQDFERHPECVLSFTDVVCGRTGWAPLLSEYRPFDPSRIFENLLQGAPILPSAVLLRKRDYEGIGGCDEGLRVAEDRDLWLRLAPLGPFRFLPLPLVRRVAQRTALSWDVREEHLGRVLDRFLSRPEGEPYRGQRRSLWARQLLSLARRAAERRNGLAALGYTARALSKDPLLAFRPRSGRRSFAPAQTGLFRELVRAFLGRRRAALRAAWHRPLPGTKGPGCQPRPEWPAFRLPPDAAERGRRRPVLDAHP